MIRKTRPAPPYRPGSDKPKPRPSGVFDRPLEAPVPRMQRQAREKRRRAVRRAPGQAQPVQRQIVPPRLSSGQRNRLVQAQTRRLGIRSPQDAERAEFDRTSAGRETRAALNQLRGARRTQIRQVEERAGAAELERAARALEPNRAPTARGAFDMGVQAPVDEMQRRAQARTRRARRRGRPSRNPSLPPRRDIAATARRELQRMGREAIKRDAVEAKAGRKPSFVERLAKQVGMSIPALLAASKVKLPDEVTRELEGSGPVVGALADLGGKLADNAVIVGSQGRPVAGAAVGAAGGGSRPIAAAQPVSAPAGMRRALEDVVNFPGQIPASLYVPLAAAAEAVVKGDTRRAKALWKDVKENDPAYALVTGDFKEFAKRVAEHPGFAAIEFYGLKGVPGRTAGAAVRGAGRVTRNERIYDYARTGGRAPAVVEGTNLAAERRYSRNLIKKRRQVRRDRRREAQALDLRQRADRAQEAGDADFATELRQQANRADPKFMTDKQVAQSVDMYEQTANARLMRERSDLDRTISSILKDAGDKGAGLSLVAQGIVRPKAADLRAYHAELKSAYDGLVSPAKKAANARLRHAIERTLSAKDPDARLGQIARAAKRYADEVDRPLDAVLADLKVLPRERGERAKLIPYAAREMGARKFRRREGEDELGRPVFVENVAVPDGDGWRKLSNEEIREHMRENGRDPDAVSYVSQSPRATSPGQYYRAAYQEPTVSQRSRTERPTVEGTLEGSPEVLRARAINAKNMAVTADNYRRFAGQIGVRRPDDGGVEFGRFVDADQFARSMTEATGREHRVFKARPVGVDADQFEAMLAQMGDAVDDPRLFESFRQAIQDSLAGRGEGPFMVAPAAAVRQMEQHLRVLDPTDFGKLARAMRTGFSRTVLSTSPGPVVSNAVEGAIRSMFAKAGPLSHYTAHRVLREMHPDDRAALLDHVAPGGRVTLQAQQRFFDPHQLREGEMRQWAARYQASKRFLPAKPFVAAWQMWTHFVFDILNGKMERFYQRGMLGKAIRDQDFMPVEAARISNRAMREAARGLTNTPTQEALGRLVYDQYGKYRGFSPSVRKSVAEYTPFLAWVYSSARFISVVLPRDHPTFVALAASLEQATEEWRREKGLDLFMGTGKLPGWLMGTVDRWQITRHTPFSLGSDPLNTLQSQVLPQFESMRRAWNGEDWKGQKLRKEDGTEYDEIDKLLYGIKEMAAASIPAVAVPTRLSRYIQDPRTLANAVRAKPPRSQRGGSSSPTSTSSPTEPRPAPDSKLAREEAQMERELAREEMEMAREEARLERELARLEAGR